MTYSADSEIKFTIGSTVFFENIDGFKSKDTDELRILKEPLFGRKASFIIRDTKNKRDVILYPPFSKKEFIEYDLKENDAIKFGKYLIPEFISYIGLTIEDLKKIRPLLKTIDDKHAYQKIICNAYIENNEFILTEEQRLKAYEKYKETRLIVQDD